MKERFSSSTFYVGSTVSINYSQGKEVSRQTFDLFHSSREVFVIRLQCHYNGVLLIKRNINLIENKVNFLKATSYTGLTQRIFCSRDILR